MKIVDVKSDYSDLTMNVPVGVLSSLAGDFDGDVLNLISIKDRKMAENFERVFSPKLMMISRDNGAFNRKFSLIKDEAIGLHAFCTEDED